METPKASKTFSLEHEDDDPLNIMMLPSPDTKPSRVVNGRTLRARQSVSAIEEKKKPKRETKRLRTVSSFGEENLEQPAKKIKVEKDRAVCLNTFSALHLR